MATLFPPPSKRQKRETAEKAQQQQTIEQIPDDLGSIRVQFLDQATGTATGPAVSVPVVDATVKNLETLLNTLQGKVYPLHMHLENVELTLLPPAGRGRTSSVPILLSID